MKKLLHNFAKISIDILVWTRDHLHMLFRLTKVDGYKDAEYWLKQTIGKGLCIDCRWHMPVLNSRSIAVLFGVVKRNNQAEFIIDLDCPIHGLTALDHCNYWDRYTEMSRESE